MSVESHRWDARADRDPGADDWEQLPPMAIPLGGITDAELELLALGGSPDIVAPGAMPDPFAAQSGSLPAVYLPDARPGLRRPWMAWVASALIAVFVTATLLGVCLTDGFPIRG